MRPIRLLATRAPSPDVRYGHPALHSLDAAGAPPSWLRWPATPALGARVARSLSRFCSARRLLPPSLRERAGGLSFSLSLRERAGGLSFSLSLWERAGVRVPQRLPAIPRHPHPACGRPLPEGEAKLGLYGQAEACRTAIATGLAEQIFGLDRPGREHHVELRDLLDPVDR